MGALTFINTTAKTKFEGTFLLDSIEYNYTLYLLPIKQKKTRDEIIEYFGKRMFKGTICLGVDKEVIASYLNNRDVSAFIKVSYGGNVASGTLQIYNWCNTYSEGSSKSQNMDESDVWINDICRVSSSGNIGNPLKALFYFMEQLVVQNLGKTNIKLYIENEPSNVAVLKPKYELLGFIKNTTQNPEICNNWEGTEIVMEKNGLIKNTSIINFNFLTSPETSRTKSRNTTTINAMSGGITKKNNKNKYKKNKLTKINKGNKIKHKNKIY